MVDATDDLNGLVWIALTIRLGIFFAVTVYLAWRTLRLRRQIEERKFAGRYAARAIVKGVFSPVPGWEEPFDQEDLDVLRSTRSHLLQVVFLTLTVFVVKQQARLYVESRFEQRALSVAE